MQALFIHVRDLYAECLATSLASYIQSAVCTHLPRACRHGWLCALPARAGEEAKFADYRAPMEICRRTSIAPRKPERMPLVILPRLDRVYELVIRRRLLAAGSPCSKNAPARSCDLHHVQPLVIPSVLLLRIRGPASFLVLPLC